MNTLIRAIENQQNKTLTKNGAVTHKSTLVKTLDFFSLGGALRTRSDANVIALFSKAFAEDRLTAVKILFYLRDIRGGQGERKTFRLCFNWLAKEYPEITIKNLQNVVEFGRWDDLYSTRGTPVWMSHVLPMIKAEWNKPSTSLLYKWLASENASSKETRQIANEIRKYLGVSPRNYRKTLSAKRAELDVVERKMCAQKWNTINYKGVPSTANLNYTKAFSRHDGPRYTQYINDVKSGKTTINAGTLYPYDIVEKILNGERGSALDVLWDALPSYMQNDTSDAIVVADVSGSMDGRPMAVSVSLALYISERNQGAFKDHFITFSDAPKLERVLGNGIVERVSNLSRSDWGYSTNIESVFNLILLSALRNGIPQSDMPKTIYIVSDMEFNQACHSPNKTIFSSIDEKYKKAGYERPTLVFWNVNARNTQTPVVFNTNGTCLVSGCSPSILKSLLSGNIETPLQVMYNTINVDRYNTVVI